MQMSLIQEASSQLLGQSTQFPVDVPKEIAVGAGELKSARFSGLLAGQADALHGNGFNLPDSQGNVVMWLEERTAYIQAYFAVEEDRGR